MVLAPELLFKGYEKYADLFQAYIQKLYDYEDTICVDITNGKQEYYDYKIKRLTYYTKMYGMLLEELVEMGSESDYIKSKIQPNLKIALELISLYEQFQVDGKINMDSNELYKKVIARESVIAKEVLYDEFYSDESNLKDWSNSYAYKQIIKFMSQKKYLYDYLEMIADRTDEESIKCRHGAFSVISWLDEHIEYKISQIEDEPE